LRILIKVQDYLRRAHWYFDSLDVSFFVKLDYGQTGEAVREGPEDIFHEAERNAM